MLGAALFLVASAGNILTPLLGLVQSEFGVDYTTAGSLVSAYGIARLSLDLPAGFLQDHLGTRKLAALGLVLGVFGAVLAAWAARFEIVVAGRVGMGLGASIVAVVVLTTLSDLAPAHARSTVLSLYSISNNASIAFFPVVGGLVGAAWGWRATMWLSGLLTCIGGALLAWILSRTASRARPDHHAAQGAAESFSMTRRRLIAIGTIYAGVIIYMVNRHGFRNTALPLFAYDRLGLDTLAIASGITTMAVVGLLVAIPGAVVADRWNRRLVIALGFVVLALGDFSFLGATNYATFLLASFLLGIGDFFSSSQTAALTELVPQRLRSRMLGGYRFSVDLGATIGPVAVAGLLQFAGYETMIGVVSGLLLLAGVGAFVGARASGSQPRIPRAQPVPPPDAGGAGTTQPV